MPKHLLIVEDEPDVREILSLQLRSRVDFIASAGNGKEALGLMQDYEFHAILSDINMPIMDGLTFLEELRKEGNPIPFVILTGYGDKEKTIKALRLGAFDFLDKPWDQATLFQSVEKAIELGQSLNFWSEVDDVQEGLEDLRRETSERGVSLLEAEPGQQNEKIIHLSKVIKALKGKKDAS